MNLLGIDTASMHASVALHVDGKTYVAEEHTLKKHAEWILEAILSLLTQAGVELSALDGIAFDAGPGSFTGLRIGCAVAKGLALGASLPLYPVSSMLAIAYGAASHPHVLTVLDARMHAWYWGYFKETKQVGETQVSSPHAIRCEGETPLWLAGVGFEAQLAELPESIQSRIVGTQEVYPSATQLLQIVTSGRIQAVGAAEAKPDYVRQQVTQSGEKNG